MHRRAFVQLAAAAPALAASTPVEVALLTHAGGPHLGAYVEGLARSPEAAAVSLSDPSGGTVEALRKGLGAKLASVYRSPAELFAARKPALAIVTMEARLAPPAISAALAAGCHVMAEKPACVRVEDFEPLAARAKASDRQLMLALANRVDPVMLEARRIVREGHIGRIYGMELHTIADQTRLTRAAYQQSWFAHKDRAGGGHLIWLGIHWLDLAVYLSGSPITHVAGFTGNVGGQPISVEDSAAISFRFANGALGTLTSGYYLDRDKHLSIKAWGSQGWLEIRHATAAPLEWYSTRTGKPETHSFQPPKGAPAGYNAWVAHVTRAAAGVEQPVLSPDDSLHVLKVIFAAYRAAESGNTQKVG